MDYGDYGYDDEASLFSESNITSDTSDKAVTTVGTLEDTAEENNVENGVNPTAPIVGNRTPKGRRRGRKGRERSAFRRGQLMLIKRLIRALERRRQKLLRGRDGGGTA